MEDLTTTLSPQMLAMVPLVTGILQALRKMPVIEKLKEYMPFIAMLLSLGMLYAADQSQIQVMPAVLIGLMSAGVYDGVKALGKAKDV